VARPVPAPRLLLHFPSNLGVAGAGLATTLTRDSNRPETALKITVMSPTEGTQSFSCCALMTRALAVALDSGRREGVHEKPVGMSDAVFLRPRHVAWRDYRAGHCGAQAGGCPGLAIHRPQGSSDDLLPFEVVLDATPSNYLWNDPFRRRRGALLCIARDLRPAATVGFGPLSIMRARSRSPVPYLPREIGTTVQRRVK